MYIIKYKAELCNSEYKLTWLYKKIIINFDCVAYRIIFSLMYIKIRYFTPPNLKIISAIT